ncbi:MAG: diguanylate cyclase [Anaerolineales bacterium]|nr:diguanylate cyclase [Anaerolineales bacterium]
MIWQDRSNIWNKFKKPIEVTAWLFILLSMVIIWRLPIILEARRQIIILLFFIAAYVSLVYYWLHPRFGSVSWLNYSITTLNVFFVGWAYYLFAPYGLNLDIIWVVVVILAGIMYNWIATLLAVILSSMAYILVMYFQIGLNYSFILQSGLHLGVFAVSGFISNILAEIVRQQIRDTNRRNRSLSFLLGISQTITTSLDLEKTLPLLAEQIARGIPATFCRISLLEKDNKSLRIFGVYPLRALSGWETGLQQTYPIDQLYWHSQVVASGQTMVLRQDDVLTALDEQELKALFFKEIKSACLVPLISKGETYGVISVGEARRWERESFTKEKFDLLQTLAVQVAMVVQTARLHQAVQKKAEQLEVLNEAARAIGSTIEMDALLEMIYQQVSRIISADTYFVVVYLPEENCLDLNVVINDGVRYPPQIIPADEGPFGIVGKTKQPLLIGKLSDHQTSADSDAIRLGNEQSYESWLGVPMIAGGEFMGMIVVTSYQANVFNEQDQALLLNIANQAAIAVDNAKHHASVEERARCDSLTGVYNHGYFIQCLEDELDICQEAGKSLSLIMLDIDLFKDYNDHYGHVIGDEVLRLTVQAITTHIKATDSVGRWGGEEFGVLLSGATTDQALQVAERIRLTLLELPLKTETGLPLVKPTVSQGIATFPLHCETSNQLVICADQALYQAKDAGRDQIKISQDKVKQ